MNKIILKAHHCWMQRIDKDEIDNTHQAIECQDDTNIPMFELTMQDCIDSAFQKRIHGLTKKKVTQVIIEEDD